MTAPAPPPGPPCACALCTFAGDARVALDLSGGPPVRAACVVTALDRMKGLRLTGATVTGTLELDRRTVEGPLTLSGTFQSIDAQATTFKNEVNLSGSTVDGDLNFRGAVFDRALILDESVHVTGALLLWSAKLTGGISAKDMTVDGAFTARGMTVTASAHFDRATFGNDVTFDLATVSRSLSLLGGRCLGEASFAGCKAGDVDLSGRTFEKLVTFRGAAIANSLTLASTTFERSVAFDEAEIRDFSAPGAHFNGAVSFRGTSVTGRLAIDKATCAAVAFDGFHGGEMDFVNVAFSGDVSLRSVHLTRRLVVRGGSLTSLHTRNCAVDGNLRLQDVPCAGDLSLLGLSVTGGAVFEHLTVTGAVLVTNARFGNDLHFTSVRCSRLDLSGTSIAGRLLFDGEGAAAGAVGAPDFAVKLENVTIDQDMHVAATITGDVALRGLTVKGGIDLRATTITGALRATYLTVARDLTLFAAGHDPLLPAGRDAPASIATMLDLRGAKITGSLCLPSAPLPPTIKLTTASLGSLSFSTPADAAPPAARAGPWRPEPPPPPAIEMTGCSYSTIDGDITWFIDRFPMRTEAPNAPVRKASPERQPFLMLERVLRTAGRDDDANAVYYQGRLRTAPQSAFWQWWPQKIFSGFGMAPFRLAQMIAFLLIVAALFFGYASGSVHHLSYEKRPSITTLTTTGVPPGSPGSRGVSYVSSEIWTHTCGSETASFPEAIWLALTSLVSAQNLSSDLAVADGCPVRFGGLTMPPWLTYLVVFALKLGGLTLIPLAIATISGILRPAARA